MLGSGTLSCRNSSDRMTPASSDCTKAFGHTDFDLSRLDAEYPSICPVRGCEARPADVAFGAGTFPVCLVHGIQLRRSETFVYWNGAGEQRQARLRNFPIQPALAATIALESKAKAENHRLGYEMSEDALTWNVFVALAEAGALRAATCFLTGWDPGTEPQLYLWGERIDLSGRAPERFAPLDAVRRKLEKGIRRFLTEPDIMLVVDGRSLVCVEAKFGSGNPMAHDGKTDADEKPKDRSGLIGRYLQPAIQSTRIAINEQSIGSRLHSQLFRNLVFASEMAVQQDWHVVNLVSETQWRDRKDSQDYSYRNPTAEISAYLSAEHRQRFAFRTWEQLYRQVIAPVPALQTLQAYMKGRSAHYRPAFDLLSVG